MVKRTLPLATAALALAAFAVTTAAEDKGQKDLEKAPYVEGKVVRARDNQLTIKDSDGREHTYTLAKEAACTIDGKRCEAAALGKDVREGQRVRIRPLREASTTAVKVEVLDKNTEFDKGGK